uniref:nucleotidyl transferase AbiEii/AbiGii toxin family protein n=1 Tax=Pedobacter schmidteae TaxID=2201271 RepID=UPI000EB3FD7E|nr:nucleotidyl transferase AbiEii/AbiGii toxin family protein [Pedobacter schmidteae]
MTKDLGKSTKAKLLNIARAGKLDHQLIVIRFLYERLLYRLSKSVYKDKFYLKGGVLLYAMEKEYARPTLDIDFLGLDISNDLESLKEVFREICSIDDPDTGVYFDLDTISAEEINETKDYVGTRLSIVAYLDSIKQPLKIDIGFGDVVIPDPQLLSYESMIPGLDPTDIVAYSLETVVAEKFQAMIDLSELNSRYKDFYDVYTILTKYPLEKQLLLSSIRATFKNRNTPYTEGHPIFTTAFAKDKVRNQQWKQFLKKIKVNAELEFSTVMELIKDQLMPFYEQV